MKKRKPKIIVVDQIVSQLNERYNSASGAATD